MASVLIQERQTPLRYKSPDCRLGRILEGAIRVKNNLKIPTRLVEKPSIIYRTLLKNVW